MKLTALEINHFGVFEKEKIRLPDNPLVIIYGSNESGKSTLMNYILAILFGFPAKNVLSRWNGGHPEGRFGGSIAFESSDRKNYRIERFYQDREADLHDERGTKYAPETFFAPVDRLLFESVFCFDLDGLRGLSKIRPDDLNQLLLGAGMLGNHNLSDLEQYLDKQMDRLFKKSGKVPEINHLFSQIDQSAKEIKVWESRLDGFRRLLEQIAADKQELEETKKKRKEAGGQFAHWQRYMQLMPLIKSSEALEEAAREAALPQDFPRDGRRQYEQLNESIQSDEKELAAVQDQMNLLDEKIRSLEIHPQWFQRMDQLQALHRDFLTDQQEMRLTAQLTAEKRLADAEYGQLMERLGEDWNEERLLHASVSVGFYQNLHRKKAAWKKADQEKETRGSQLRLHRQQLEQLKVNIVSKGRAIQSDQRAGRPDQKKITDRLLTGILLAFTGVLALAADFAINGRAALIVLLSGIVWAIAFATAHFRRSTAGAAANQSFAANRRAENAFAADQLAAAEAKEAQLERAFADASKKLDDEKTEFGQWCREQGYSQSIGIEWIEELAGLVREAKTKYRRVQGLEQQLMNSGREHRIFLKKQEELAQELESPGADCPALERQLERETEQKNKIHDLEGQKAVYAKQKERLDKRLVSQRQQLRELFRKSGAAGSSAYEQLIEASERKERLTEKLGRMHLQMLERAGGETLLAVYLNEWHSGSLEQESEESFRAKLAALDRRMAAIRKRLIEEEAERHGLEADDSYRDARDHYEALRTELQKKAEKWAIYQTARWAIQTVKDRYRAERMPRVLQTAGAYLSEITSETYGSLELDSADGFIACRSDGRRFTAAELSRGTAEQIYLSLRLALTDVFASGKEQMPIIVDEGFVNFDGSRTEQTEKIFSRLARNRQIILFTCHFSDFVRRHPDSVVNLDRLFPSAEKWNEAGFSQNF